MVAAAALLALGAADASATTRYAAPGGTATPIECTNAAPGSPRCTIFTAAQGPGVVAADEVVIEPGNYLDVLSPTGDLGPTGAVTPVALNMHGAANQPRPVITLNNPGAAGITVQGTVSHLEIHTSVRGSGIRLDGAADIVDGVVVRSSASGGTPAACSMIDGTLRNSACLATGAGARAVSGDGGGLTAPKLRGVTAVSSGSGSTAAIAFGMPAGSSGVSVRSTIARAPSGVDVKATETGGNVSITLDYSNYGTTDNQMGAATVTAPGTPTNQTGLPALAADGYHQLPSSTATINLGGPVDPADNTADIDGQFRGLGGTADIGADDLGNATSTTLTCTPASLVLGSGSTSCYVLVRDTTVSPGGPGGTVAFATAGPGAFATPTCELIPIGIGFREAECTVSYTPNALGTGTHNLSAVYVPLPDDRFHEASQGTAALGVTQVPPLVVTPVVKTKKKCKKGRKLKRGKCVKKKRKRRR